MEDKNKKIITLLVVFTIIFTVIGSSLAYFNWQTSEAQQTSVVFTAEAVFSCSVDGGGNITSGDVSIVPTTCDNSEHVIKRTISTEVINELDDNGSVYLDLWLDVNVLDTGLSESENFNYILSTSSSCTDEASIVESGNFNEKISGDKIRFFRDKEYLESLTNTYYLYIWLDAEETSSSTMDQEFDLSLNGKCTNGGIPEEPELDDGGMIPVIISDDGTVNTISKDSIQWYDYDSQEWANIVLVTEGSRDNYLGTDGVTVASSDIVAYYVWIPRYTYHIWATASGSSAQTIEIIFQSIDDNKNLGTTVLEYLTHPAFTFGTEELAGIWVGKFETTGDGTTPTVLPNISPLVSQNVSTQFQTGLKFSGGTLTDGVVSFVGSSTYGLASTTDSHMMKNREWGAVAYLSHSEYGINKEVGMNNHYWTSGLTGCGTTSTTESSVNQCEIKYGSGATEYPQSTTGNITGIYDMSAGMNEHVMAVLNDTDGNPRSGNTTDDNSGFNGMLYDGTMYEDGVDFPPAKYYDTSDQLGYAINETWGWYSDLNTSRNAQYPWSRRGSSIGGVGSRKGVFAYDRASGGSYNMSTFRSVLIVK